MDVDEFDYHLPPELIAQYPAPRRDEARLLVLNRTTGAIVHTHFVDLPGYLKAGDVLVLNNTKVFPARLYGKRADTGGKIEVLLLEEREPGCWEALVRPGRRAHQGLQLVFGEGELEAEVGERTGSGGRLLRFAVSDRERFWELIFKLGQVPLPPYIKRAAGDLDKERYQTVYARTLGSVAAPTAGLHFTQELLQQIARQGVQIAYVLLHVGIGTFRPVRVAKVEGHVMHSEYWRVEQATARLINETRERGGRLVAVGTTSVRVLESAAGEDGVIRPGEGWTDLFIYPGYRFRAIDGLVTNFHLPRSTLLMLVCAFAGKEKVLRAYEAAVARGYRFFSYGDAMLLI